MFPLATLLTLNIKIYQGLQKLRKPYPSPRPTTKSLNSPQEIPKERASLIRTPIFRKSENRQNLSSNMTSMTEDEARIFFHIFSVLGFSLKSYISHWYIFWAQKWTQIGKVVSLGNSYHDIYTWFLCFSWFFLQEQRDRDTRFTRASILMVLAFGLCHTPRLISNILEMFYGYETPWVSNIQYMNFINIIPTLVDH